MPEDPRKNSEQPTTHLLYYIAEFYAVLAVAYGVFMIVFMMLWLIAGEENIAVNMFVSLFPLPLLPGLVLLPLGLLLRKWSVAVLVLPAVIAFGILYGEALLPPQTHAPASGQEITALTYNILYESGNYQEMVALIRKTDADFIAIQEASTNAFEIIRKELRLNYPYIIRDRSRHLETLLISRYPVLDYGADPTLYAIANVEGQKVLVQVVHLPSPHGSGFDVKARYRHLNPILDFAGRYNDLPVILMGDFNMSDGTAAYRRIAGMYQDSFRMTNRGFGFTFPNWQGFKTNVPDGPPLIRIDYIFTSEHITPLESRVIHAGTSDHYPVWARLLIHPDQ